jgi:hypothetical protein
MSNFKKLDDLLLQLAKVGAEIQAQTTFCLRFDLAAGNTPDGLSLELLKVFRMHRTLRDLAKRAAVETAKIGDR